MVGDNTYIVLLYMYVYCVRCRNKALPIVCIHAKNGSKSVFMMIKFSRTDWRLVILPILTRSRDTTVNFENPEIVFKVISDPRQPNALPHIWLHDLCKRQYN